MVILALNSWRYSVRYRLYDWTSKRTLARGTVERVVVGDSAITHEVPGREPLSIAIECPDHHSAVAAILATVCHPEHGVISSPDIITAVAHRVVHGGERFHQSVLITPEVLDAVREAEQLAPLHNSPNIAAIEAALALLPAVPHVAIFDTAFHQTMPQHAYVYPLPLEWYQRYGVRRYGFHGPSHIFAARRAGVLLGKAPTECNLITLHIGKGVSLCAIREGVSVDTSMGFTPLEGAMMDTRSGDIDPGIHAFIMQAEMYSPRDIENTLNQKSGLLGVTGRFSDRRDILCGCEEKDERCTLALEMETYRLRKYIGSYFAAIGRVDALVFTAGVGEMGWQLREKTLSGLQTFGIHLHPERNRQAVGRGDEYLISTDDSPVKVFVIPTDEELVFVEDTVAVIAGDYTGHATYSYSFADKSFSRA